MSESISDVKIVLCSHLLNTVDSFCRKTEYIVKYNSTNLHLSYCCAEQTAFYILYVSLCVAYGSPCSPLIKPCALLQEMMQIFAVNFSRSLWMLCALCQRPHCLTREPYHQCGLRWLREPPSSSGLLLTDQSLTLCITRYIGWIVMCDCLPPLGPVMYMEVPAQKATFLFRTST